MYNLGRYGSFFSGNIVQNHKTNSRKHKHSGKHKESGCIVAIYNIIIGVAADISIFIQLGIIFAVLIVGHFVDTFVKGVKTATKRNTSQGAPNATFLRRRLIHYYLSIQHLINKAV